MYIVPASSMCSSLVVILAASCTNESPRRPRRNSLFMSFSVGKPPPRVSHPDREMRVGETTFTPAYNAACIRYRVSTYRCIVSLVFDTFCHPRPVGGCTRLPSLCVERSPPKANSSLLSPFHVTPMSIPRMSMHTRPTNEQGQSSSTSIGQPWPSLLTPVRTKQGYGWAGTFFSRNRSLTRTISATLSRDVRGVLVHLHAWPLYVGTKLYRELD